MTTQQTRICILGGGFGGLYTAIQLDQFPWEPHQRPEIVLVDQRDHFLFLPLLYELVTGELQAWEIAPPYAELLANTGIHHHQDVVTGLDLERRRIQLKRDDSLTYDRLVLALGGETPMDTLPGVTSHAIPFRSLEDAYRLQDRLRVLELSQKKTIRVAIAGAGYSGVELACKLADRLQERGSIRLVDRGNHILRSGTDFNRTAAQAALSQRHVVLDLETAIQEIGPDHISLAHQGQMEVAPVDLVLWTVGTQVVPLVRSLPVDRNQRGQVITTSTLQVPGYPEVFALGELADCQDATGQTFPTTAQAALQQAGFAARNLWAELTEQPLLPCRYQHLGEMLTLGTNTATLTGLGLELDGMLAYVARRLTYLYRMPTLDHQVKVAMSWMTQPLQQWLLGYWYGSSN